MAQALASAASRTSVEAPVPGPGEKDLPDEPGEGVDPELQSAPVVAGLAAPLDEDSAPFPSEETEAAMRVELAARGEATLRRDAVESDGEAETLRGKAPELGGLIERIPAEIRETMEELFRAKFTGVKRVTAAHLK